MLTILAATLFTLSLLMTSIYPLLYVLRASSDVIHKHKEFKSLLCNGMEGISIIIPAKGEPYEVITSNIEKLIRIGVLDQCEVILVLDDSIEYVRNLVPMLFDIVKNRKIVVVARIHGYGRRNGAMNDGVRFSMLNKVMILDADTYPDELCLSEALKCEDVCVCRWVPEVRDGTRTEEAMAFVTGYGSWVFYSLRAKKDKFLFPLGSGTIIKKSLIADLGLWPTDVVQDDIWLGFRLMSMGIRPKLLNGFTVVGVPKTVSGARIQQTRWAYGALNVVSRFIGSVIKSPLPRRIRAEALMYVLQPLTAALNLFAYVVALVACIVESSPSMYASLLFMAVILALSMLGGLGLSIYGKEVLGLKPWRRIVLTGRSSALFTMLAPIIGLYGLAGLLRLRYVYKITPKTVLKKIWRPDISELISLSIAVPSLILSLLKGNSIVFVMSLLLILATIYTMIRLER